MVAVHLNWRFVVTILGTPSSNDWAGPHQTIWLKYSSIFTISNFTDWKKYSMDLRIYPSWRRLLSNIKTKLKFSVVFHNYQYSYHLNLFELFWSFENFNRYSLNVFLLKTRYQNLNQVGTMRKLNFEPYMQKIGTYFTRNLYNLVTQYLLE